MTIELRDARVISPQQKGCGKKEDNLQLLWVMNPLCEISQQIEGKDGKGDLL